MKPDFAGAFAEGVIQGAVGLLTQPIVIVTLGAMLLLTILSRRLKSRNSRGRSPRRRR